MIKRIHANTLAIPQNPAIRVQKTVKELLGLPQDTSNRATLDAIDEQIIKPRDFNKEEQLFSAIFSKEELESIDCPQAIRDLYRRIFRALKSGKFY